MPLGKRQEKILDLLRKKGTISVNELTEFLQVSPATVRRDLERLEQEKFLLRTYGGAIELQRVGYEPSYIKRLEDCVPEKRAIAQVAAKLIEPGDIVALDAGTTTTQLARILVNTNPLTVVTPSLTIGQIFAECDSDEITVIMPGGMVRSRTLSMVGPLAEETLLNYRCDKAVIGCHSLTLEHGAMNTNLLAVGAKKALVAISKKVIVVADHTKFERIALATVATNEQINVIVTDWQTPSHLLEQFRQKGIEVLVAPCPTEIYPTANGQ